MGEARRTITIVNRRGLHARASAKFVGAVAALPDGVKVTVSKTPNSAAGGIDPRADDAGRGQG